jgi:transposase
MRAKMIAASWDGDRTRTIAARLGCHLQTVRERLARFNAEGLDGLGDRPGAGRKRRITQAQRGQIIALARSQPPGRAQRTAGGERHAAAAHAAPQWTLDTLAAAAQRHGVPVQRSQVRRSLLAENLRWRPPAPGRPAPTPQFAPKTSGRRLLHPPASAPHGALRRRAGPGDPPAASHPRRAARLAATAARHRWPMAAARTRPGATAPCGSATAPRSLLRPSRNRDGWIGLLAMVAQANPRGPVRVVTDNPSSHTSASTRTWLVDHPRIRQLFTPKRACWRNLQEGWWRLHRREAFAGQSFATPDEITLATTVATLHLNARARPWVWGRPPPFPRPRRLAFTYRI